MIIITLHLAARYCVLTCRLAATGVLVLRLQEHHTRKSMLIQQSLTFVHWSEIGITSLEMQLKT